jgi:hypothetical protein
MGSRLVLPVLAVGLVIFFVLLLFATGPDPTPPISEGISQFAVSSEIPESYIVDENNSPLDLATEEIMLVTFWRASCEECDQGLKDIQTFSDSHPDIKTVLINISDSVEIARQKLEDNKITLPTYYDQDLKTYTAWSGTIPASYYIENGKITYFFPGRVFPELLEQLPGN